MKNIMIAGLILATLAALVATAYLWKLQTTDDPLASQKLALSQANLERLTEKEKQKTEEAKQQTALVLSNIATKQAKQQQHAVVVSAPIVVTAKTWATAGAYLLPYFLLASGMTGAGLFYFFRRVRMDAPISGVFPRKDAFRLASMALQVQYAEAAGKVAAFSEETTRHRLQDMTDFARAIRPGRENVTINNALPAASEQPAQAGNMPTFQQAVKDFQAGSVLVGYDSTRQPAYIPLESFVSCAFGGGSGSGKTSKLRFLVAQLILQGVNVSILDAHAGNEQSLADSLGNLANMPNVRIFNPFETAQAVKTMLAEVQAAIDTGKPADVPYVYVLDELRPLNRACENVEVLMDKIANEGRKYDRFMVASSQTWEAKMFKQAGSAARDACVLKMAARMPKEQARTLFKDGAAARTVAKLAQPEMYAESMLFSGVVDVPFCTRSDLDELAASRMSKQHGRNLQADALPVTPQTANGETAINDTENLSEAIETTTAQKTGVVLPFRRRNDEETGKEREIKQETPFLSAASLREILAEKIARNEETLSGIANKAGVSKGQLHRFLKENQTPSENLLTALQVFAGTPGTPANPTGTEA